MSGSEQIDTVLIPILRAVLIILHAISPLLAIKIFFNMLKRDIVVFFPRIMAWTINCGRLAWPDFKPSFFLIALAGIVTTYLYMQATLIGYETFGRLWTVRFVGFCVSTTLFTILTAVFMGESPSFKDGVTLLLVCLIIWIQVR